MGEQKWFHFDINQAIYNLDNKDISRMERELDYYKIVFEEYQKILRMEIKRSDETRNLKDELKKHQQRRTASNQETEQ